MSAERKALWLLVLVPAALAAGQNRIQSATDRSVSVEVRGSQAAQVAESMDLGTVSPNQQMQEMRIEIAPTAAQQAELDALLAAQSNPQSADYHQWLTPEEFGDRFGASDSDMAQVRNWLESEGFHVSSVARAHNSITFDGTAATVQTAFQTEIHSFRTRNNEIHFANASEPRIPAAFAGVVTGVRGLDDFKLHPMTSRIATPDYTASNGAHYLSPNDLASVYDITNLYNGGYNGNGQKLAVIGQTQLSLTDIRSFRSQFGLTANDPQLLLAGTNPGVSSADVVEADLDVEWAGAVARNATIVYVYSQNVFTSLIYAVDNNVAPVITMSYGGCETGSGSSYRAIAQQANAEGITWFNATGDTGAAGCDYGAAIAQNGPAVQFPSNIPEVTAVGGSEFSETGNAGWNITNTINWASATGYIAETSWNDSTAAKALESSTGGASTIYPKPWWQAGPGVPADGMRDVPDVALSASASHDGYLVYSNGSLLVVGGTSASTPAFAGIATLINQYLVAKGLEAKAGLGNINPTLYSMAQTTTGVFHDITTGSNVVPCVVRSKGCTAGTFGFEAGAGYDMVTGLGSVDAYNLAAKWSLSAGVGTTMTLTSSATSIAPNASAQVTAIVNAVSGTKPPTGSVTLKAGSVTIASMAVTAISGAEGNAKFTVNGSALLAGANTITASYQPTGNFASSSMISTVTVSAPAAATSMAVTAAPASIQNNASTTLTATMKALTGSVAPAGSVTFTVGGTTLGTTTLSTTGAASITVSGSSLTTGANVITASYAATSSFAASMSTVTVTVTAAPATTATTLTATAAPASIAASATTTLTVAVKAASGNTIPTGGLSFKLGTVTLGTATLTSAGTASLSVKGSSLSSGSNNIVVSYTGSTSSSSTSFAASTGSVTVTVSSPASSTSATTLTASTSAISSTSTTTLTAIVTASGAASAPAGSVTFTAGSKALGTVTLTGAGTTAIAIMVVPGSSLTAGVNSITAAFSGSASLSASTSAPANVTVAAAPVATSTIAVAGASSIANSSASTTITVTVKAASGSSIPTGTVTATAGKNTLGTATLSASGTATITVAGSKLAIGANTISVAYAGATGFNASTGATTITLK